MIIITDAVVRVIVSSIRTNTPRCALYMKIHDLLDEETFLEHTVVELAYYFDEKSYHERLKK